MILNKSFHHSIRNSLPYVLIIVNIVFSAKTQTLKHLTFKFQTHCAFIQFSSINHTRQFENDREPGLNNGVFWDREIFLP